MGKYLQLRWALAIFISSIAIFIFDINMPLGIAGGVPYVVLVLVALYARDKKAVVLAAILGNMLTVIGFHFSPTGAPSRIATLNRILAQFAISTTAITAYMHLQSLETLIPLAFHDRLTGLHNRHFFQREANRILRKAEYSSAALIIFDIDHFKLVNDTFGHLAGDEVLRHIGRIAHKTFRDSDLLGRIGGEEFAVILPDTTMEEAINAGERLRINIENHATCYQQYEIKVTVSLGICAFSEEHHDLINLIEAADTALYAAKKGGRNRTETAVANTTLQPALLGRRRQDKQ